MGAIGGLIGPIIGGIGSIFGGMNAAAQADYQAEVAKMNQKIAQDNAKRAIDRSQIEQEEQDRQTKVLLGEQEAAQGASGLSLSGPTQMKTRKGARQLGRLDALRVRQAGELEAYNYKTEAVNQGAVAEASRMSAQNDLLGGYLGAAGSLVGGASSSGFNLFKKKGSWFG